MGLTSVGMHLARDFESPRALSCIEDARNEGNITQPLTGKNRGYDSDQDKAQQTREP
eukprot:CAMPEP_0194756054 /NCGR_PEP_ID=MMETSP0323_2-20130528/9822_1 /TAXON_ID=2866 ORGANISM="Crypthecodinium cohnii, Strain Seligo" /NCGR_SAMPLE_ID=MMETSP0323_2 /ASSEMBLY_ACC=CAM_ASM_000346 /LENGTH=56 /DNA_ID=CAMNT_0039675393 /DNA_START=155 /DNA_END=322 /DNA_ORIENTATION=+